MIFPNKQKSPYICTESDPYLHDKMWSKACVILNLYKHPVFLKHIFQ